MKFTKNKYVHFLLLALICIVFTESALAQVNIGAIKGKVKTVDGKAAADVTITIQGSQKRIVSDENGAFELRNIKPGDYVLQVSLIGYQSLLKNIVVESNQTTTTTLELNVSDQQLQEVIISSERNKLKPHASKDVAKIPLSNLENPQVYSTVSKELLLEQAVFSADAAIKNSPGITALWNSTGRVGDGGSIFSLRGFTAQTNLRNGVEASVNSTTDAANLERLEIIKGPSGTLYGSSLTSYGGLINRITKKPYDHLGGEINYSTGNYGFNRISADINTPLDSARRALLRINTAYNNIGSFQDNGFSKSFAFDPSFSYKINDRLTISVEAEISHSSATTPVMYFFNTTIADLGVINAKQLSVDYKKSYQSNDIYVTTDNVNFFGLLDYKISDHWKSQTNISSSNGSSKGAEAYFYLLPGNDSISRNVWTVDGTSNALQIQQNFIGDFNIGKMRNRIVAGLDFLNQSTNIRYIDPANGSDLFDYVNTVGAIPNYNDFDQTAVDQLYQSQPKTTSYNRYNKYTYSAYVSDVLNITDKLMAMASLRVDYFSTKPIVDATTNTSSESFNQTTLSPKFGLVYQVVKDKVALFGNYMNGFSNPGYYLAHDAATNTDVSKLFKSEQANQWEGGVKLDVFDGKLSSTISYYDISVKNIVRSDAQNANAYVQDGTQYSKGLEAEVSANPFQGFNILVGYAHNNSKMEKASDYSNGRRPQTAGPANSGNLWLSYTLAGGSAKGLGIGFGGNYASDNQVINNSYNGVFTLPSYTVLNSGLFYNQAKYRISLNVNNLTNKEYWIGYTTVNPQMLRQFIGSFHLNFN